MTAEDKIGVLLPVYRGDKPEYLSLSVESILGQSHRNMLLLLGVDGPVGEALDACLNAFAADRRVRIVRFDENRGLASVLNDLIGICLKEGLEFFARMDADDISLPDRFEKQLDFLVRNPEIDVVGGAIMEIDEKGASRNKTIVFPSTPDACRKFFARRNPMAHPAVLFRKRFFEKIGGLYRPEYRQNQDTLLWFDGLMHGVLMANIPDPVLCFRMSESLFRKRRNGYAFARKQLCDRLMINKGLRYGFGAALFARAMFLLMISPVFVRKIAYRFFR